MSYTDFAHSLTAFIQDCPSMFHSVAAIAKELKAKGFSELREKDSWNLSLIHI